MRKLFRTAVLILALPVQSYAGWVIVEHTRYTGSSEVLESTLYIQDNMLKSVDDEQILIFDLDNWLLTYVSQQKKGYWTGKPADYLRFVMEFTLDMLEEEIKHADRYERPALQALYDDLKMNLKHDMDAVELIGELPVEIIMTEQSEMIVGYRSNRYLVYFDRVLVEEVWLTPDIDLGSEYDFREFRAFIDEMSWNGMFANYRSSDEYIHLMKSGMPMRTVEDDQSATESVTEVVMIENRQIPASEFYPPKGYSLMELDELAGELHW